MNSFLFLGIFSAHLSIGKAGLATCTDENCPEGFICHENICKKCLECELLFRKGNLCVIDFNDCKECMEGYEELLITNLSNVMKPCKPKKKKIKLKTCKNDSNCSENNYCDKESCVKCFDCSLLNRMPPRKKCAKGLTECGLCMMGFHEVSVTTAKNHKPCEKDTPTLAQIQTPVNIPFIPMGFILGLMIIVAIILKLKTLKGPLWTKKQNHRPIYPSAPPLHSSNSPEYVRKIDGMHPTTLGYVEEKKQQAKVFKLPSASYYYIDEETNQLDNGSRENNGRTTPNLYTSSNSNQSGEMNCSGISFNEHSDLSLNASGVDPENENPVNDNDSHSLNSVASDVIDAPEIFSENSSNHEIDSSPGNESQEQI